MTFEESDITVVVVTASVVIGATVVVGAIVVVVGAIVVVVGATVIVVEVNASGAPPQAKTQKKIKPEKKAFFTVGREGFEPPTPCASCRCSSQLS